MFRLAKSVASLILTSKATFAILRTRRLGFASIGLFKSSTVCALYNVSDSNVNEPGFSNKTFLFPHPGLEQSLLILLFFEANHLRIAWHPLTYLREKKNKNTLYQSTVALNLLKASIAITRQVKNSAKKSLEEFVLIQVLSFRFWQS